MNKYLDCIKNSKEKTFVEKVDSCRVENIKFTDLIKQQEFEKQVKKADESKRLRDSLYR